MRALPDRGRSVQRMTAYSQLTRRGQVLWSDSKLRELVARNASATCSGWAVAGGSLDEPNGAAQPALLEGINYVADTLLFAGIVLLAAAIMPGGLSQTAASELPAPTGRAQ